MQESTERRAVTSVLVVDDDPTSVRMLERILRSSGFGRVLTSTDSSAVPDLCTREHPDLVLLDLAMPAPDGFAVLEMLRPQLAAEPPLRVLVLSGHEHPAVERQALDLGAAGAIAKTAGRDELLERLDAVLAD